jgi:hypothetical protein
LIDADTGLYYLRARYYDPSIGRFLTQDPVPAVNLYAYVGNNPVNYVDPSGLCIPGINCPPGLGGGTQPPSLPKSKEGSNFVCTGQAQVFFMARNLSVTEPHIQGAVVAFIQVTVSGRDASVSASVSQVDERFGSSVRIKHNFGDDVFTGPLDRVESAIGPQGTVASDLKTLDYELVRGQRPTKTTVELFPRLGQRSIWHTPLGFSIDLQCSRGP